MDPPMGCVVVQGGGGNYCYINDTPTVCGCIMLFSSPIVPSEVKHRTRPFSEGFIYIDYIDYLG